MCKTTNTSTQKQVLPGFLEQTYKGLINAGTAAAKQPLKQYSGPRTAGFTPMQQQAFDLTSKAQGMGIPYLNAASQALGNASGSVYPTLQKYNMGNLQQYLDPYTQSVIDTTMANMQKSDTIAQQGLRGQGMAAGISPGLGDRMGLAQAELERNQGMNRDQTIAQLQSQGFQNAQQQFLNQQQMQASTMGSDLARQMQAASGFAGLGQQAQDQAYQGINALLAQGGQQQQLGQQQLDQAYQTWQERQNYPKSQIEWLANLAYGQPHGSTTTQTTPAPSLLSQLAGLATAGTGLYKTGIFGKRGGAIRHMDAGGEVDAPTPEPTIAAPMMNLGDWSFSGGTGLNMSPANTSPGLHVNKAFAPAGMYINALPQLGPDYLMHASGRPGPWVTSLPNGIFNAIKSIPYFSTAYSETGEGKSDKKKGVGGSIAHMAAGGMPYFDDPAYGDFEGSGIGYDDDAGASYLDDSGTVGDPLDLGVGMSRLPVAHDRKGSWESGWPLVYMGLGMMSGESPNALTNIGKGALEGLNAYQELDKNPVVDDSGPTIRVYYPSEHRWEDTGIPSTAYAKLQLQRQLMSGTNTPLTEQEIKDNQIPAAVIAQRGRPFWQVSTKGRTIAFPVSSGGVNVTVGDPNAPNIKLSNKLSEKEGDRWDALMIQGQKAANIKQQVEALRAIADAGGNQGVATNILRERFPQFSSVSAAFKGVAEGMLPDLRVVGSGSQSDAEYAGALAKLGRLSNDPVGNKILWSIMDAKSDLDIARGNVISDFLNSNQTQQDATNARLKLAKLNAQSILTPQVKSYLAQVAPDEAPGVKHRQARDQNWVGAVAKLKGLLKGADEDKQAQFKLEFDRAFGPGAFDEATKEF